MTIGCEECYCDSVGSYNSSCDVASGQCYCKSGVSGLKCDQCMPHYYAFSDAGCTGIHSPLSNASSKKLTLVDHHSRKNNYRTYNYSFGNGGQIGKGIGIGLGLGIIDRRSEPARRSEAINFGAC